MHSLTVSPSLQRSLLSAQPRAVAEVLATTCMPWSLFQAVPLASEGLPLVLGIFLLGRLRRRGLWCCCRPLLTTPTPAYFYGSQDETLVLRGTTNCHSCDSLSHSCFMPNHICRMNLVSPCACTGITAKVVHMGHCQADCSPVRNAQSLGDAMSRLACCCCCCLARRRLPPPKTTLPAAAGFFPAAAPVPLLAAPQEASIATTQNKHQAVCTHTRCQPHPPLVWLRCTLRMHVSNKITPEPDTFEHHIEVDTAC